MKLKNLLIFLIILTVLINISCIYATDHNTEILGENNEINIYVDANTGEDSNTGDSWETPVKSIGKAIDLTDNNKTTNIYLGNGTYKGENNIELKIENKNTINIFGSDNTVIHGENLKQILTLSNIRNITLKNIQFVNATSKNINYGVAITIKNNTNVLIDSCQFIDNTKSSIYNEGTLTITNTYFINNKDRSNDSINDILGGAIYNKGNLDIANSTFKENYAGSGGAIYNAGNLTVNSSTFRYNKATNHGGSMIVDSIKTRKDGGRGGDICNFGNATITNTTFKETQLVDLGARGGSIYNNGTMILKQIEISNIALISDDPIGRHSAGTAIANIGNLTLEDSLIANITTHLTYQGRIQGAIHNEGLFTATGTLFVNNKYDRVYGHQIYYDIGTGNIYNTGSGILNITSCAFFNENQNILSTVAQDVAIIAGAAVCLENNSWSGENPLTNNHLYGTLDVTKYWLLSLEPDYSMIEIGGKANITQTMKLMYEKNTVDYGQLPDLYVTFNVNGKNITKKLVDGKASVEFNQSDVKGSYVVTSSIFNIVKTADVDVGKEHSAMQVEAEEIYYGDDAKFYMTVTGNYTHQPKGNITVIIDENKYTTKITDTKASITIPGLLPKTYDLIIRYEGDEDYSKAIFHHNYTVHKKPTYMNITIPEINYGETGTITVSLTPTSVSTQAYMYITDENNKTTKKTVFVKNGTEIKLKNYASGEYNVTIELWDNPKFASSSASAIFRVNKFATNITITSTDINAGETEILNITLTPEGEVAGEAILKINNHTQTIFLNNGLNTIKLENLAGGNYNVSVTFQGDKKYAQSTATCTFTVKMLETNITAKIENNILYINTTQNSTGKVFIYINDDIYEVNLTNSAATFPVNFKKAENYIFIYYPGDGYYDYATYNFTYENVELINLTGYDETFYNTDNITYYVTLTDEEGYGIPNKTITININKKTYEKITADDGSILLNLDLNAGNYKVTAQYKDKKATNTITILEDAVLTGNDTQAYTDTDFAYTAELKDHNNKPITNQKITFNINGKTYTNKTNNKGIATLNLNLPEGNYIIKTTYKTISHTNNIYIADLILKGNDITAYNTENATYKLTLTDKNGTGAPNQKITITLNNKTYTRTTDKNGQTTLNIKLNTGKYTITAQYNKQKTTNTITILEDAFISANNTKAYENVDFPYMVLLVDHNNKALTNKEITFTFDGKTYTNTTNDKGIAVLNLNLKEGNYTIKASYKNKTVTNKLIIIDDSHLVGNDVKAYSGTDFTYRTKLTDHNGKAIKNAEITFEIDGKTYTNKTNSKGESTLTFNLETGNYTITATYKKLTIENNFEIIEDYILAGNDVKAYSDTNFPYNVKLTDHNGKAIKNAEITFKINGKTYTNKTDVNGQAIINLNLKTGTYTITARYRNTTTTNTLIIIEDYILNGNDIKAYADDDFTYKVNLTDHNGKAIKNAEITFEIDGKTYTNKTNNQGLAIITLNLKEGNYTITAKYRNITTNNELEIIENHILTGQNVKAYENTDFTYTATLKRIDGTPIPDKEITFIINNRRYTDITNKEGKASKTLNLPQGNYTITAIYKNTRITNNLTIIEDYNLDANNIRAYANDNFQYKVNLTDHNKNPIKNAEITFEINGQTYKNKTDNQGQAILNLNLKEGNYTITAKYQNIKTTNMLEIIETYTLEGINVKSYENFDFKYRVTLKNHNDKTIENAEITFEIDGKTYTNKTNNQGLAIITLNLKEGNYTITAKYKNTTTTNKLNIIKYDLVKIESSDLVMYYKDGSRFAIRLTENGTALTNKTVQFTINGNTYKRSTDDKGYASIAINLNSGIHNITTRYNNISTTNTITIKSTIEGNDLTKIYKNDTQYYATFYNSKGTSLKNTKILFNINGVMYERTTNENGQAKMNINLIAGTYIITAINPENGEQHSNTITVLSKIQENKDLTKYYKNASQYVVKIIDSKGNPVKAGQKVTFNINGVFYERYTDETGHVKMNINLLPGEYIITAEYEGCQASNKIKVLPTLKASDLTKKYGTKTPFEATLIDGEGKPLKNTAITFNINGVFYTRTTDENGIAKLNINLMPGEYIITSSYNGLDIANKVKINS